MVYGTVFLQRRYSGDATVGLPCGEDMCPLASAWLGFPDPCHSKSPVLLQITTLRSRIDQAQKQ